MHLMFLQCMKMSLHFHPFAYEQIQHNSRTCPLIEIKLAKVHTITIRVQLENELIENDTKRACFALCLKKLQIFCLDSHKY